MTTIIVNQLTELLPIIKHDFTREPRRALHSQPQLRPSSEATITLPAGLISDGTMTLGSRRLGEAKGWQP